MSKNKCLFIVPKFPSRSYPWRAMWPDYIWSHLRETSKEKIHSISDWDILDLELCDREDVDSILLKKLENSDYAFIWISYLSLQAEEAVRIAEICDSKLKQMWQREESWKSSINYTNIVLWWRWTIDSEEIAHYYPYVDFFVVWKEFYQPFDSMTSISRLITKYGFISYDKREDIKGIVYYDKLKNKSIKTTVSNKQSYDTDFYFSNLERKNHSDKHNFQIWRGQKKTAQIYSWVWCQWYCTYCFESMRGNYREDRSLKSIIDEVLRLVKLWYKWFFFEQSTFTENKKRALKLIKFMWKLHRKLDVDWSCNTRIDCIDKEILDAFIKNGMYYIRCWVETLVPEVVEWIWKITPRANPNYLRISNGEEYVQKAKEIYSIMNDMWIDTDLLLVLGCPRRNKEWSISSSTIDDDKKSIHTWIWDLHPTYINFNVLKFLPDATISRISSYKEFRWWDEYRGSFFYKEWKKDHKIKTRMADHKVYLAFNSAFDNYPIPSYLSPEACYDILSFTVDEVNKYYTQTWKDMYINIDNDFWRENLKRINNMYILKDFDELI